MLLLDTVVQPYPWGRRDGIAAAVGRPPTGEREAELWVGTHERGPSLVCAGPHAGRPLAEVIGSELPFLLKVLAIGEPLSLQAHPSAAQAERGFVREEAAGIPLDAAERTYRDPNPKPEALVALTEVDALCGFRSPDEAARLVQLADDGVLAPLVEVLGASDRAAALGGALAWLLHLDGDDRVEVASAARQAAGHLAGDGPTASAWRWVGALADHHPGDPSCLAPLLLEVVHLEPGESVHLPAGNLHAYLGGTGVEIMAASDNVLRGGLTTKHVDVDELLSILRLEPGVPPPPQVREHGRLRCYDAGESAFALAVVAPGAGLELPVSRPSLLLPVGGPATVERDGEVLDVAAGRAVYVPPGAPIVVAGAAPVWWATTGDGLPS